MRAALACLAAALVAGALAVAPAAAQGDLRAPRSLTEPPAGKRLTAREAIAIASRAPTVRAELREDSPQARPTAYVKDDDWQVSWFVRETRRTEVAQARVDDDRGVVLEAWRDHQVAWTMARGYDGAFGRSATEPWVWIPLSVLFVLPFVDPRRPWRLLHLDLAVLSAFSISLAFFNAGAIEVSVPLAYPLLAYLLVRMLWIGLRRRGQAAPGVADPRRPVRLLIPVTWMAVAVIFLLGFRVGLNVVDSKVIDVGYAGVIGADRLAAGQPLYGSFPQDNRHGDTYGPVNYLAYVPFEQVLGWSGAWDGLPAAHAAAIAFDLLMVALLFLLGRLVRGPALGLALAYAWVAYPFTLYVASANANDTLVGLLVTATLLVAAWSTSPGAAAGRGALTALAGLTKFAPLALGPLLVAHRPHGERLRARGVALYVAAFLALGALSFVPVALGDSLGSFWSSTLGFQASRGSPFSVWGLWELQTAQRVVQGSAVALAVGLALLPRRRDLVGLAALCAAVLIATQLGVTHWFYLYLVWFFPLVMLALLVTSTEGRRFRRPEGETPAKRGRRFRRPEGETPAKRGRRSRRPEAEIPIEAV